MGKESRPGSDTISDSAFADIIRDVLDHLEDTSEQNISQEFQLLEMESEAQAKPSRRTAVTASNFRKNRYKDILPFDDNRVILDDELDDDYINASFIQDHTGADFLIASQAPLPGTVDDFWRMCWLYKVPCILMLCNLVENGRKKCEKYYPSNVNEPIETDHFWIFLEKHTPLFDDLYVRTLTIEEKQGSKGRHSVKHVQYTSWPDFGISESLPKIEMLIKACQMKRVNLEEEDHLVYGYVTTTSTANESRQSDANTKKDYAGNPLVVHCSAGCGRTGTIACLLYIVKLLETKSLGKDFSLVNLVLQMRQQRLSMVQNQAQYAFLIKFVHEYLLTRALRELTSEPQTANEPDEQPLASEQTCSTSKLDGIERSPDEHSEYEMCWNSESFPPQSVPVSPPPLPSPRCDSNNHEYSNIEDLSTHQEEFSDVIAGDHHDSSIPVITLSASNPFVADVNTFEIHEEDRPKSPRNIYENSLSNQRDVVHLKRVPAVREHRSVSPFDRKKTLHSEKKEEERASVNLPSPSKSGIVHEYVMLADCHSDAISSSDLLNPISQESEKSAESGSKRKFALFPMQSNSFRGSRPAQFSQDPSQTGQTSSSSPTGQLRPSKSQENLYDNIMR